MRTSVAVRSVEGQRYSLTEYSTPRSVEGFKSSCCTISSSGQMVNGGGGGWGMVMLKDVRLERDSGTHSFWFKFKVLLTSSKPHH
jgi:hypothetical protein